MVLSTAILETRWYTQADGDWPMPNAHSLSETHPSLCTVLERKKSAWKTAIMNAARKPRKKKLYELGAGVYREQFATNRGRLAETGKKACTGNAKTAKRQRPARRFRCNREWYNAKYSGQ
jgi:hypothetical protein